MLLSKTINEVTELDIDLSNVSSEIKYIIQLLQKIVDNTDKT